MKVVPLRLQLGDEVEHGHIRNAGVHPFNPSSSRARASTIDQQLLLQGGPDHDPQNRGNPNLGAVAAEDPYADQIKPLHHALHLPKGVWLSAWARPAAASHRAGWGWGSVAG